MVNQPPARPVQAATPIIRKKVLMINQAAKIIIKPMNTEVIIDFAVPRVCGLPPAKKNITPPIISIKTATAGTRRVKIKSKILSSITKKWQS